MHHSRCMARHLYVFDFDGTIADTSFPRPHTPLNLADAMRIMDPSRVAQDRPRQAVIDWMQHIALFAGPDSAVKILTGRPEASRDLTQAWLLIHGVPYDEMVMVGTAECKPVAHVKRGLLAAWRDEYDSVLVVDDDPHVGTVCAELGIGFVNAKEMT